MLNAVLLMQGFVSISVVILMMDILEGIPRIILMGFSMFFALMVLGFLAQQRKKQKKP